MAVRIAGVAWAYTVRMPGGWWPSRSSCRTSGDTEFGEQGLVTVTQIVEAQPRAQRHSEPRRDRARL